MPINCPVLPGIECTECPSYSAGLCKYFLRYPRPISEILTTGERLSLLEASPLTTPLIDKNIRGGVGYRGEMDRLKAQVVFLQNKINYIYDRKKQAEPVNWAMDKNGQTMDTDLQ